MFFIFPSQEIMLAYYSMPSLSVKKVNADALAVVRAAWVGIGQTLPEAVV
jgi:hypothetical protein